MGFGYDFRRITTREALLDALGIHEEAFKRVLEFSPPPPIWDRPPKPETSEAVLDIPPFYRHDIPKTNVKRGHRTVWEPVQTKSEYKALARRLDNFFRRSRPGYPHDCAFGYRSGRNIRENAAAHTGQKFLLSLDIKDFFPSISRVSVASTFRSLGIQEDIADLLSRFITIADALPLGFPTSPTISNLIAVPIDEALSSLAAETGAVYTRYSDDLTFSGNGPLPKVEPVRDILSKQGFEIADDKTRRSTRGQAHYVTGLSISDPVQPHIPKEKKRRLRQELYYAKKFGLSDHFRHCGLNDEAVIQQEINRLDGMVKFVSHHEPRMAPDLQMSWRSILEANGMRTSFVPRGMMRRPFFFLIDEAEFTRGSEKVLALCIVATQHVENVVDQTQQVLIKVTNDLWADGNVDILRAKGLHFTDATEDTRMAFVKELAKMPFEVYVAYCAYESPAEYEATYLRLLSAMISRRLMAAESQHACLFFEQNNKVRQAELEALVQRAMADLSATNNRRPAMATVSFLVKPNPALSAPDFLLGVLGKYLASKPAPAGRPEPRERLMFERLRDKYRLILDVQGWTEYSRRNPLVPWG